MIYLDWAATGKPDPEILEKVTRAAVEYYGNPSSVHGAGREAERILGESRTMLAGALSCGNDDVVFTSGGTESNNMLMYSLLKEQNNLWI